MSSVLEKFVETIGDLMFNQPERTPEEFIQWMKDSNEFILHIELIDNERWVSIERLLLHYTIKWGVVGDYINGYEDNWCITTDILAVVAFSEWKARDFAGEPNYWHRNPKTGRRREDGDPEKETIRY